MACPWERDTCSKACAVFTPIMLILLPKPQRIVNIPLIIIQLFAAKASSWRSPNSPGTSDTVAPRKPLRRL
eukprot:9149481-Pyramimonas_sp.AAC.1